MPTQPIPQDSAGSQGDIAYLTVAAVARRLGIAPGTLRTWDRRYGLGPTEHACGQHRRYSSSDLARLTHMHRLVISGVAPADAAKLSIEHPAELAGIENAREIPAPSSDKELVRFLFRAAEALNRDAVEREIRNQIIEHGTADTWINVLVPLLWAIGEVWESTGEGIAAEHLVTDAIKRILGERILVESPRNEVPVLLACVGEELHSLAITALAAALAEENIQVHLLGARTPLVAIAEVVRRSAPPAIFLWKQLPENCSLEPLKSLPAIRPAPRVILGGPGWSKVECKGAYLADNLVIATREISQALGL